MLNMMRRFANSWPGKILGMFLLLGLAGFGISNVVLDLGSNALARVGGVDVTTTDFMRLYQARLNDVAQQTGQLPTNEQAIQFGIPTGVLGQLTARAAVDHFAQTQAIGVSDQKLAELVRDDPSFAGTLGTFDRALYEQALRQQGVTNEQYFDVQRQAARRQQVALGLFAGTQAPATGAALLNRYQNDQRTIEYATLNFTNIAEISEPTEAELTAYLAENRAQFRTEETRAAEVLHLNLEALAALPAHRPGEAEIAAEYERQKDQLVRPEKREIRQAPLATAEIAAQLAALRGQGVRLEDALIQAKLTAVDLGVLAKAEISDQALADAAFGLGAAGDFTIVPGVGGQRLVGIAKIEAGGTPDLAAVRPDIESRLAKGKAKAAYADLLDGIEELRAALKPLGEIAARYDLPVASLEVTAEGAALAALPHLAEADRAKAAAAIFSAEIGKLAPTVSFSATDNLWFALNGVDPARGQTLAEVRDIVAADWTAKKTEAALAAEAAAIVTELAGKPLAEIAAARQLVTTISAPITRKGDDLLNSEVADAVFAVGPGGHGSVINGDGDHVIFVVTDVTPATDAPGAEITGYLRDATRDGLYADFTTGLTDELWPASARDATYRRMLGLLTAPQ